VFRSFELLAQHKQLSLVSDDERKGMPIHLDKRDRSVVDFNSEGAQGPDEWHPMNGAAKGLCRCLVALGDIEEALEHYFATSDAKKCRRRMRAMSIPLHSLCVAIIDTINVIQSDVQLHSRLPTTAPKELTDLRTRFSRLVPFDRKGKLGVIRNRISAHLDRADSPSEMRAIVLSVDSTEFGEWIHACIGVVCDLLKLDAYMWTASTAREDLTLTMCQEPIMAALRVADGHVVGFEGAFVRRRSPKFDVFESAQRVCKLSQGLFERPSRFRISGFYEDNPKNPWARMLRDDAPRG
jgi:hypothetical protein